MLRPSPKVLSLVAAGAMTLAISTQFISEEEGRSLVPYRDVGGVLTICDGNTHGVTVDMVATNEECDRMTTREVLQTISVVDALVSAPMSAARKSAVVSFVYNVGAGNFERSTLRKKLNAKDPTACAEFLKWRYAGGKDCSVRANNCYGVYLRRQKEQHLCSL
jgi:lysozyme